jgi:hypothetical protein
MSEELKQKVIRANEVFGVLRDKIERLEAYVNGIKGLNLSSTIVFNG